MDGSFRRIVDLKNSARAQRKLGHHTGAARDLLRALGELEAAWATLPFAETPGTQEIEIAKQLADCYGSLGGAYRENGDLLRAIEAYDNGFRYESDPRFGIVDSYNRVQRLVVRVLAAPEVLAGVELGGVPLPESGTVRDALRRAAAEIRSQLRGVRRGDAWAVADLGVTSLLAGDEAAADAAWDDLDRLNPTVHVYETTAKVLNALADKNLPMAPALRRAAARLEDMAG